MILSELKDKVETVEIVEGMLGYLYEVEDLNKIETNGEEVDTSEALELCASILTSEPCDINFDNLESIISMKDDLNKYYN
jgi:hypothetical protein